MRPTRKKRLDEILREVLADILLTRTSDPRLAAVTVTAVRISPELDVAKVFVSALGDETRRAEAMAALRRAAPFLRTELARATDLRRTPELRFHLDESMDRGLRMESVLKDLADERASRDAGDDPAGAEASDGADGAGTGAPGPAGDRDA